MSRENVEIEISEIRDLGDDRLVAIGRGRTRGTASGAETLVPTFMLAEFKDGKAISIRNYSDLDEALEAAKRS